MRLPLVVEVGAALAVLGPFALSGPGAASGGMRLPVDGLSTGVRFADVDGDGVRDALVGQASEAGGVYLRAVRVFSGRRGHGGPRFEASSPPLALGADALFLDAADLDRDGRAELLVLDVHGLSRHRFEDGGFGPPEPVAEVESFFRATSDATLPFVELAKDLDGDGRHDLLIPGREGYVFLRGAAREFEGPYPIASASSHRSASGANDLLRWRSRLARPTPLDWEGDGRGDLVLSFEGRLSKAALGRSGPPGPMEPLLDLTTLLDGGKAAAGGLVTNDGRLSDVDGDGRIDLLLAQRIARPGLTGAATTRHVLLLAKDLAQGPVPRPRQLLRTEGLTSPPRLFDLDRDGALDLVVSAVRTDVVSKLRESVVDATRVTFLVFRFEKERERFSDEPVHSVTLEVPPDALLDVGAYGWVTFEADYDGDGRPDLATYEAKRNRLSVRKGIEERGFFSSTPLTYEDEPFFETEARLVAPFFGEDVDGDGRAEIVAVNGDHVLVLPVGAPR